MPLPTLPVLTEASRQGTAGRAAQQLVEKKRGFRIPTAAEKRNLLVAFAKRNLVVYGKAFDAVRLSKHVDLTDLAAVRTHLDAITVYEIKSTNRKLPPSFKGYFFALTGAEMLVRTEPEAPFQVRLREHGDRRRSRPFADRALRQSAGHLPDMEHRVLMPVSRTNGQVPLHRSNSRPDVRVVEVQHLDEPREKARVLFVLFA